MKFTSEYIFDSRSFPRSAREREKPASKSKKIERRNKEGRKAGMEKSEEIGTVKN